MQTGMNLHEGSTPHANQSICGCSTAQESSVEVIMTLPLNTTKGKAGAGASPLCKHPHAKKLWAVRARGMDIACPNLDGGKPKRSNCLTLGGCHAGRNWRLFQTSTHRRQEMAPGFRQAATWWGGTEQANTWLSLPAMMEVVCYALQSEDHILVESIGLHLPKSEDQRGVHGALPHASTWGMLIPIARSSTCWSLRIHPTGDPFLFHKNRKTWIQQGELQKNFGTPRGLLHVRFGSCWQGHCQVLAQDSVDRPFAYLRRHGTSFLHKIASIRTMSAWLSLWSAIYIAIMTFAAIVNKTARIAIMTPSCRLPPSLLLLECHWNFAWHSTSCRLITSICTRPSNSGR